MKAGIVGVAALVCGSCVVGVDAPTTATISCRTTADCPLALICAPGLRECVPPGTEIEVPELRVSFSEPGDGAQDVSVRPTVILAFSARVALATLDGRVRLERVGGEEVSLERNAADTESIFRYALAGGAALASEADYQLIVDGGVEPAVGEIARPLGAAGYRVTFRTGPAPDLEPPAPITDLVVERLEDRFVLSWSPPPSEVAGYLVLRRDAQLLTAQPVDGTTYTAGATFGDALVAAVTSLTTVVETEPGAAGRDYVVFAYDEAKNYSPGRRAPLASGEAVTWCTDETGSFVAESPSATGAQLWIAVSSTAAFAEGALYPPTPAQLSTAIALPVGGPIAVGGRYWVRVVLTGAEGHYRGPVREWTTPPAAVTITQQPLPVAAGGVSTMHFDAAPWPAYEAEADTDPIAAQESWAPATVSGASVSAPLPSTGEYRLRIRPVVAGCAPAAWTLSAPVRVGDVLYVDPAAVGDGSGKDPQNAFTTIAAAIAAASQGTTIFVRGGETSESLVPPTTPEVTLIGSFGPGFSPSDLSAHPTRVVSSTTTAPLAATEPSSAGTFVAFAFENTAGGAGGCGVEVTAGTTTLDGCRVRGTRAALCVSGAAASPTIQGCDLLGTGANESVGASVGAGATPFLLGNRIDGGTGTNASVAVDLNSAGALRLEANDIDGGTGNASCGVRAGGTGTGTGAPELVNNVIDGGAGLVSATGVALTRGALVVNNTIDGGRGAGTTVTLELNGYDIRLVNNLLYTSAGAVRVCVWVREATTQISAFLTSALFDCPTALFREPYYAGGDLDFQIEYGVFVSIHDEHPTSMAMANYGGNIAVANRAAIGFAGADDLHLTVTSPDEVRFSGHDARLEDCGYDGGGGDPNPCGAVVKDKDGAARTCPQAGTACYSMGAFEQD